MPADADGRAYPLAMLDRLASLELNNTTDDLAVLKPLVWNATHFNTNSMINIWSSEAQT